LADGELVAAGRRVYSTDPMYLLVGKVEQVLPNRELMVSWAGLAPVPMNAGELQTHRPRYHGDFRSNVR
jgi:hypothetical protein